MSINIKNERVSQLAVQLAEKTGESITDAVGHAIEEKLAALDQQKRRKGEQLRAIAKEISDRIPDEWRNWDWEAELYDEQGLPK